jgi:MFS family permease
MVVDLDAATDVNTAGYVSGYVSSAFLFGRVLSSFYWGKIADRIGRLPVVYIGLVATAVGSIVFGLSLNIYMAITSRYLSIYLSNALSVYPFIYLSIYLMLYISNSLSIYLSIYQSNYLSIKTIDRSI